MKQAAAHERRRVQVRGIVQGVGFRPFIYALAHRCALAGLVRNDAEGVHIEVEGEPEALDRFLRGILADAPPLAVVETVAWQSETPRGEDGFRIEESREGAQRHALVSPDVATCDACLAELFKPADRRYRYPFINCTNCGPRFTITRSVPYDRAMTTMAGFAMCPACQGEYGDPADRRFHAQPNACPVCGPRVRLLDGAGREIAGEGADPITRTARLLRDGAIMAIKGLGGYHLACDPFNAAAVGTLRSRKVRQDKPFALMALDLAQAQDLCWVGAQEAALLSSPARPIVLLKRRPGSGVAEAAAPRQRTLGVMLAYTPLHHLLLHDAAIPLVMTSGNRSDEPIAYCDDEAFEQLGAIADYFLVHDRPIHMRCDDSVVRVVRGDAMPSRRSRGYAPAPLSVSGGFGRHVLACGGELKNTFCLAKEGHAFLSHHIGDLENYETLRSYREGIEHFSRLFDIRPDLVAYDLHPQYFSTAYARELEESGVPALGVQHHHAHIASCLADNQRPDDERVIGVAMDGTGYGSDGAIWGGEFLEGSLQQGFVRRGHLEYVPMPGGEAAIRQPWRMALAHLIAAYGEDEALALPLAMLQQVDGRQARPVARMAVQGLNSPLTSSAGRLFDAVAALLGLPGTLRTTYESQAAIELELAAGGTITTETRRHGDDAEQAERENPLPTAMSVANPQRPAEETPSFRAGGAPRPSLETPSFTAGSAPCPPLETPSFRAGSGSCPRRLAAGFSPPPPLPPYAFALRPEGEMWVVETRGIIRGVVEDLLAGRPAPEIAARFHGTMAAVMVACCRQIREASGLNAVALSGGTFQNLLLLEQAEDLLTDAGFVVYRHRRVPTNDGGLSLGQAILADRQFKRTQERTDAL